MKKLFVLSFLFVSITALTAQYRTATYCNPLNLDYSYPFHNAHLGKSYRSGADPAVVQFRGEFY
ncbi:MAG: 1,4-beta-xylanase, partial [Prevotellaceae bacterium]|nr:1,4-beta-xylanase [Prevotellaceae bacterium]